MRPKLPKMSLHTDARIYSALRIVFGLLSFWCFASCIPFAREFFSNEGWLPPQVGILTENQRTWSLLYLFNTAGYATFAVFLSLFFTVTMTIGLYSRTSTWIVLAFAASFSVRNHFVFSGEDCILRNVLFLVAFSRCGDAWSLDRWLAKRRYGAPVAEFTPLAPAWPLRLLQIQVCLVYFTSGLAKQRGTDWLTGIATLRALLNPTVSRWSYDFLVAQAWLFKSAFFQFAEQITLYWELLFPFLMLQRHLRNAAVAFGVVAHLSIFVLFQVHFFSFAMCGTYLTLAPRGWIPVIDKWMGKIEASFDGLFVELSEPVDTVRRSLAEPPVKEAA